MQEKFSFCKQNGHKNVTEMQNRRDTIPNQRMKPASNAGLMDGGRPDNIRDNGRCDPTASRGNGKKKKMN